MPKKVKYRIPHQGQLLSLSCHHTCYKQTPNHRSGCSNWQLLYRPQGCPWYHTYPSFCILHLLYPPTTMSYVLLVYDIIIKRYWKKWQVHTCPAFAHAFISAPIVTWSGSIGCISALISDNTSNARSTAPDWPHALISALKTTRSGFTFYCTQNLISVKILLKSAT